jgi:hypothetical protein
MARDTGTVSASPPAISTSLRILITYPRKLVELALETDD